MLELAAAGVGQRDGLLSTLFLFLSPFSVQC